jgi:hypothetical protein
VAASVIAALTGVSSTGSAGSVDAAVSCALAGNEAEGLVGSIVPSVTAALSGVSGIGAVGSLGHGDSVIVVPYKLFRLRRGR